MAEQALKKLEDHLNCPICLDTYTDPKQLQCHHVYCQKCLVRLVVRNQQGQLILNCPSCRQVTPVPAGGVAGLQAAFQVNQLLEIVEGHKKAKGITASVERVKTLHGNATTAGCPEHDGKEVELYCETCGETICFRCIMKDEKHHSHNYEDLSKAFVRYKNDMIASMNPMQNQLVTIKKALAQLDTRCEEISKQQVAVEDDIHGTIAQLHQTLDVRKAELIGQLHQLTQDKLKSLDVQRDQIVAIQAQLSSCLHFMKENLKAGSQGEALLMKSTTVRQVKELAIGFQHDLLEPNTDADMSLSTSEDITAVIQNYGRVHKRNLPDPSKCSVVPVATVGDKSTALFQTLDFSCLPSKDSISCELVSKMTGTRVDGSIERIGQSQYEMSYKPLNKGRHQLNIRVADQHIRGSPFLVIARSSVEKLGTPILTVGGMNGPEGVAVNQRGEVVVTERSANHVSVFSPSGEKLRSFGTHGFGPGQFNSPHGVAIDNEGCILVTDRYNNRVQKFSPEGRFLTAVGTRGSGPLQFSQPLGIAYNASNGKVYVADRNRVQILNSDLSYVGSIGEKGSGKGQFNDPHHIACDSNGNVYVADLYNHRVQVFAPDGKWLRMFGRCYDGKGKLRGPDGLAIDYNDRVYVSQIYNIQ